MIYCEYIIYRDSMNSYKSDIYYRTKSDNHTSVSYRNEIETCKKETPHANIATKRNRRWGRKRGRDRIGMNPEVKVMHLRDELLFFNFQGCSNAPQK